jgi:hypothetical protein
MPNTRPEQFMRVCLLFVSLLASAVTLGANPAPLSNRLAGHPSPYLALHADDPTAWQDWGPEAVARAQRENKLLYISIGYFSCHWCHVMQQESYRNPEIAAFLNEHFVPVKVDRELEPALDSRMIDFVERTRGMAGWPLNVFVTPDGNPLYAVLYLPPEQFLQVIRQLSGLWREDPAGLAELARHEAPGSGGPGRPALDAAQVEGHAAAVVAQALAQADPLHGGFGEQSKFPSVPQLDFMLDRLASLPGGALRSHLELTLDHMAGYGLYDHVGDGFFRYTVDPDWHTPHFEKMLYDNALLARLYLRAARVLGQARYRDAALRTLDFMTAAMRAPQGAFVASLSALDDEGVEGGYYLWHADELERLLGRDDARIYRMRWDMLDAARFEAGYLPINGRSTEAIAASTGLGEDEVRARLARARETLRAARSMRSLPVDGKLLAGWNGLALAAFADAARETGNPGYRDAAGAVRDYLLGTLWDGRRLLRAVDADGRPMGRAAVEDYAYVAEGLLAWARLSGSPSDYAQARSVVEQAWSRFYGENGWRLSEDSLITAEPGSAALMDGPMPSPSGVIARVSLALAARDDGSGLRERALAALNSGHSAIRESAFWYATQIGAMVQAGH